MFGNKNLLMNVIEMNKHSNATTFVLVPLQIQLLLAQKLTNNTSVVNNT